MLERIERLRMKLGMNQGEFSAALGLKQYAYSKMIHGKQKVRRSVIETLHSKYNANIQWLETGDGYMFDSDKDLTEEFMEKFSKLTPEVQESLRDIVKKLYEQQERNKG